MQEQNWKESLDPSKEQIEVPAELPPTELVDEEPEVELSAGSNSKSHLTELRRRIEERLDSKRIDMEYDWDELDDLADEF